MAVKVTRIHTCGHHFTRTIPDQNNMEEIKPRMLCKCHKCMLSAQHIHQRDRDELHSIFECVKHDSEKKIRKGLYDAEQCAASVLIEYCAAVAQTMNMSREDRLRWIRWQHQCGEWREVGGLTPPHDVVEFVPQSLIKGVRYVSAHG